MLFMNASDKQNYNVGHFTFLSCTLKFQQAIRKTLHRMIIIKSMIQIRVKVSIVNVIWKDTKDVRRMYLNTKFNIDMF